MRSRMLLPFVMTAALLLTSACSGSKPAANAPATTPVPVAAAPAAAAPAAAAPAPATKEKVTLRLDWLVNGYGSPFALAKSKGYYDAAGLDVTIAEGKGSALTAQVVGQGEETFGLADAAVVATTIAKGVPIKVVAVYTQKSPAGVVYLSDKVKIEKPEDLIGKRGGHTQAGANRRMVLALLGKYNIPAEKVTIRLMDAAAKTPALLDGQLDYIGGYLTGDYLRVKDKAPTAKHMLIADFGVNVLGSGIVVSDQNLKNKPQMVKAFIEASNKGWEDSIKDPQAAVDATMKIFPLADPKLLLESLKLSIPLIHTSATQGKPIGWMSEDDWKQTVDIMANYGGLEGKKPSSEYFTNEFIPSK